MVFIESSLRNQLNQQSKDGPIVIKKTLGKTNRTRRHLAEAKEKIILRWIRDS